MRFRFVRRKGQDRREKERKKNETATKREGGGARGKKEVARGDTKVSKDVTRERERERAQ